jgi:hypothetical protein
MAAVRFLEKAFAVLNVAGIQALIGNPPRLYASALPEGMAVPAVVQQVIAEKTINTLDGPSGLRNATLQLDCYAESYDSAQGLADAVAAAMSAAEDVDFSALQVSRRDLYETAHGGLHRVSLDFSCWGKDT